MEIAKDFALLLITIWRYAYCFGRLIVEVLRSSLFEYDITRQELPYYGEPPTHQISVLLCQLDMYSFQLLIDCTKLLKGIFPNRWKNVEGTCAFSSFFSSSHKSTTRNTMLCLTNIYIYIGSSSGLEKSSDK